MLAESVPDGHEPRSDEHDERRRPPARHTKNQVAPRPQKRDHTQHESHNRRRRSSLHLRDDSVQNGTPPNTDVAQAQDAQAPSRSAWPMLLDVEQVSELTGLSESTIRRRADAGDMPKSRKIGGLARWITAEVFAWVQNGCPRLRKER